MIRRYSYANNNPLRYNDPTGHEGEEADIQLLMPVIPEPPPLVVPPTLAYGMGQNYNDYMTGIQSQNTSIDNPFGSGLFGSSIVGVPDISFAFRQAADLAIGFTPYGVVSDLYTLLTGKLPVSQEEVSTFERIFALVPLVTEIGQAIRAENRLAEIASQFNWGRPERLAEHFQAKGAGVGANSVEDYARRASEFFVDAQQRGLPTKIDDLGNIRMYDPARNLFGAYNPDGTTRTFFAPRSPNYWNNQRAIGPWMP